MSATRSGFARAASRTVVAMEPRSRGRLLLASLWTSGCTRTVAFPSVACSKPARFDAAFPTFWPVKSCTLAVYHGVFAPPCDHAATLCVTTEEGRKTNENAGWSRKVPRQPRCKRKLDRYRVPESSSRRLGSRRPRGPGGKTPGRKGHRTSRAEDLDLP